MQIQPPKKKKTSHKCFCNANRCTDQCGCRINDLKCTDSCNCTHITCQNFYRQILPPSPQQPISIELSGGSISSKMSFQSFHYPKKGGSGNSIQSSGNSEISLRSDGVHVIQRQRMNHGMEQQNVENISLSGNSQTSNKSLSLNGVYNINKTDTLGRNFYPRIYASACSQQLMEIRSQKCSESHSQEELDRIGMVEQKTSSQENQSNESESREFVQHQCCFIIQGRNVYNKPICYLCSHSADQVCFEGNCSSECISYKTDVMNIHQNRNPQRRSQSDQTNESSEHVEPQFVEQNNPSRER